MFPWGNPSVHIEKMELGRCQSARIRCALRRTELRVLFSKAEISVLGDDDMIQYSNAEQLSGRLQSARYDSIFLTGARVPTRMVVNEKDGRCRAPNRISKNLAGMHQAGRQRA